MTPGLAGLTGAAFKLAACVAPMKEPSRRTAVSMVVLVLVMTISFDLRLGFPGREGSCLSRGADFRFDFAVPRSGSGKLILPWTNVGRPGAQKGSERTRKERAQPRFRRGPAN